MMKTFSFSTIVQCFGYDIGMGKTFSVVTLAPALDFSSEYVGPGQKYGDYSAFGQITGLYPCLL